MWKGILLLYALGANPTDQPLKTTGWPKTYLSTDSAICQSDIEAKAAELNAVYLTAELATGIPQGRWQGFARSVR